MNRRGIIFLALLLACAGLALSQPVTITTPSPLPDGYSGVGYQFGFTATTTPPGLTVTWSLAVGSLNNPPPGLSVVSNGGLTGTIAATASGVYTFTVQAQVVVNSTPFTTTKTFSMNVITPQISITGPATLPGGTLGFFYSATFTASTNAPSFGITWSASASIPGLNLTTAGVLSGVPTTAGTFPFTVTAQLGSTNFVASKSYAVAISAGQVVINTTALPLAPIGASYSAQLTASPSGVTWALINGAGSLPPGIGFNLSTGVFSGVPTTPGAYSIPVRADLAGYQSGSASFTLYVTSGPLKIVQTSIPIAIQSQPYQTTLTGSGGLPPYQWSTDNGIGMLINSSTGTITGIAPATLGSVGLPIILSDSTGGSYSTTFSLFVAAPLAVSTTSLPNGLVGISYSQALQAGGGQSPYTWSLASGPLPPGLTLSASGLIGGVPTTSGTFPFTVQVGDAGARVATKALSITVTLPASVTITTASLPDDVAGVAYAQTLAASGGTLPYTWSIAGGALPTGLSLDPRTGIISGTPTGPGATFTFTVQVSDSTVVAPPLTAQKTFSVSIIATLIITTTSLPTGTPGVAYSQGLQASGGKPGYTWSIASGGLPSGLSLNPATGVISGTPLSSGTSAFVVAAADTGGQSARQSLSITIGNALAIVTGNLSATVGSAFSQTLAAVGGTPPYSFALTGGALPTGVTFAAGVGVINGTPTAAGTFNLTFTVADASRQTASATISLTVSSSTGASVVINTTDLPSAPVGVAYSTQLSATPAGVTWTLINGTTLLPPGIGFNGSTGVFSGIPTVAGAYPIQVRADLQGYQSAQATFTLFVTTGTLRIVETSIPVAIQGQPYQTTLTPSGGLPPYQWSTSNTIGMKIDPATGTISGTAPSTLGAVGLPVTLSDSTGTTYTNSFSLFVAAPLSVLTTSLPNGVSGVSYSQALLAGGGQAPYAWSLAQGSGPLPTGLSLSGGGSITGVPTATGAFSFTVQVSDAGARVATKALSITVSASGSLTITTASLPDDVAGVAYTQTLAASGGVPPYTWAVVAGALPAGLSLDPKAGVISGTPPGPAGTFSFTIQVTDSTVAAAAQTAQKAFTVNITAAGLTITTPSLLPNGVTGVAYSQTLQASGGKPPYTWSITSGSLPPGLTLNPTSGVISGTAGAPSSSFTVQVTDASGQSAQSSFHIDILPPLTILTTGISFTGTVGVPFSKTLTLGGGVPPYSLALTAGTLPPGITFSPVVFLLSGTPTATGTFPLTFTATDTSKQTASATINFTVTLPPTPPVTFSVGSSTQPPVTLCLGAAFPAPVTATLSLSFQPSSSVAVGTDQSIQFASPGEGTTATFTVPQCGSTNPTSAVVTMGTVAGTITIAAKLTANGVDITPANLAPQTISIAAAPPVIQSVTFSNTGGGLTVTVIGYSSTREIASGNFTFAPASGNTLSQSSIPVQLGSAFTTWYQSPASFAFGSQFKLTIPFTVSGSASSVVAVTVTLTNTKGTSPAVSSQ